MLVIDDERPVRECGCCGDQRSAFFDCWICLQPICMDCMHYEAVGYTIKGLQFRFQLLAQLDTRVPNCFGYVCGSCLNQARGGKPKKS